MVPLTFAILASLRLNIDPKTLAYELRDGNVLWLRSTPLRVHVNGAWHTQDDTLTRNGPLANETGVDRVLGSYRALTQRWTAGATAVETTWKTYGGESVADSGMVAFESRFPDGATGCASENATVPGGWTGDAGNRPPVLAFPAFNATGGGTSLLEQKQALQVVTWQNNFAYPFSGDPPSALGQGFKGGPMVLVDDALTAAVLAPLDHFKHWTSYQNGSSAWEMGASSELLELPAGFTQRTLLTLGAGVTDSVKRFGDIALALAGTNRSAAIAADRVVNYLGYCAPLTPLNCTTTAVHSRSEHPNRRDGQRRVLLRRRVAAQPERHGRALLHHGGGVRCGEERSRRTESAREVLAVGRLVVRRAHS